MATKKRHPENSMSFLRWTKLNNATLSDLPVCELEPISLFLAAPSNLILVSSTEDSLTVSAESNSNGNESNFIWQISTLSDFSTVLSSGVSESGQSVFQFQFENLIPGTRYFIRTKATGTIDSAFSEVLEAETPVSFGLALRSDGINDTIRLSQDLDGISIDPDNWSVSMWLNFNSEALPTYKPYIFQIGEGASSGRSTNLRYYESNGLLTLELSSSGQFVGGIVATANLNLDSNWHHVLITRKTNLDIAGANLWDIYIDGALVVSEAPNGKVRTAANYSDNDLLCGDRNAIRNAAISIDSFEVFHRYINELEAQSIYNIGNGSLFSNTINPFIQLKFNKENAIAQGDNSTLDNVCLDTSGNGYHADIQNFSKIGVTSNWVDHD